MDNISFYNERRHTDGYVHEKDDSFNEASAHPSYAALKLFLDQYVVKNAKCLEIGSGKGMFQNMVEDYTGVDIAEVNREHYCKPFFSVTEAKYPFEDETFDVLWSIHVFEHIPQLQEAMNEIKRLLKPDGLVFFWPAWQCRSWAADGYPVRPYSDFDFWGKLIKFSIPLRDSVIWRSMFIFPKRIFRHLLFLKGYKPQELKYKKIKPNWEKLWTSDSDACNAIDPHDAILWFENNGFSCLSHPLNLKALLVRTGPIILRKLK